MKKLTGIAGGIAAVTTAVVLLMPSQPPRRVYMYIADYAYSPTPQQIDYSIATDYILWTAGVTTTGNTLVVPGSSSVPPDYVARRRALRDSVHAHGGRIYVGFQVLRYFGYQGYKAALETIIQDSAATWQFAVNVVSWIKAERFDGVDLDWEYPPDGKTYQVERLMKFLRMQLNTMSPAGQLTAAGYPLTKPSVHPWSLNAISYMDAIHLMWYEMGYGRGGETNLGYQDGPVNRPTRNELGEAINYDAFTLSDSTHLGWWVGPKGYVAAGWPKHKINIGIPVYLSSIRRAGDNPIYVGQPFSSVTIARFGNAQEMKTVFKDAVRHVDAQAGTEWYSHYDGTYSWFLSMAFPVGLKKQMEFMVANGYGGPMIWEASQGYINLSGYQGDRWEYPRSVVTALRSAEGTTPPPIDTIPPPPQDTIPLPPGTVIDCDTTLRTDTAGWSITIVPKGYDTIRTPIVIQVPVISCDTINEPPPPFEWEKPIYRDALIVPWIYSGWPMRPAFGVEIIAAMPGWGAFGLRHGNWGQEQTLTGWKSLKFRARAGGVSGKYRVAFRTGAVVGFTDITVGTTMSEYSVNVPGPFYDFFIQNYSGSSASLILDDVRLVK